MLNNPKDPLHKSPDAEKHLFTVLARAASGFTNDQVVGAAVNLLVNAIRQNNASRAAAMGASDKVHALMRQVIDAHYDAMGKRRNVFPFHQIIEVPHLDARKKIQTL